MDLESYMRGYQYGSFNLERLIVFFSKLVDKLIVHTSIIRRLIRKLELSQFGVEGFISTEDRRHFLHTGFPNYYTVMTFRTNYWLLENSLVGKANRNQQLYLYIYSRKWEKGGDAIEPIDIPWMILIRIRLSLFKRVPGSQVLRFSEYCS